MSIRRPRARSLQRRAIFWTAGTLFGVVLSLLAGCGTDSPAPTLLSPTTEQLEADRLPEDGEVLHNFPSPDGRWYVTAAVEDMGAAYMKLSGPQGFTFRAGPFAQPLGFSPHSRYLVFTFAPEPANRQLLFVAELDPEAFAYAPVPRPGAEDSGLDLSLPQNIASPATIRWVSPTRFTVNYADERGSFEVDVVAVLASYANGVRR